MGGSLRTKSLAFSNHWPIHFAGLTILATVALGLMPVSAIAQHAKRNPLRHAAIKHSTHQPKSATQQASYVQSEQPVETVMETGEMVYDEGYAQGYEHHVYGGDVHPGPLTGLFGGQTLSPRPLWVSLEYLLWWDNETQIPALATTSAAGTARDDAGVLGVDSTSVLFGGDQLLDTDTLSGGRLTAGLWVDAGRTTAIVGRFFAMGEESFTFSSDSGENPILARPFFNSFTDEADALLLGFPDAISGDLRADLNRESLGAEALVRQAFREGCNFQIDLVYGYRYLRLDESMGIDSSLEFIDPDEASFGTVLQQQDQFDFDNRFHGGEIGFMGHSVDGRWTLDFVATVSLGQVESIANIQGQSISTPSNGSPVTLEGGLLTQSSNIGRFTQEDFAVVPEFSVAMGYFITPRLDFSIGYTFLYINQVVRANRAIDTRVNLTQQSGTISGPATPEFQFRDSEYWLQGINFGLNLRY